MEKNYNELKLTKKIINIFLIFAVVIFVVSIFSNMYKINGVIYNGTDDAGDLVGTEFIQNLKVYHFIFKIEAAPTFAHYNKIIILLLYIITAIALVLNFIKLKENNKLKQYIVSGILLITSISLIIANIYYQNDLRSLFDEFADSHLPGSYLNVTSGVFPFLSYILLIIFVIFSLYNLKMTEDIELIDKKNERKKKK